MGDYSGAEQVLCDLWVKSRLAEHAQAFEDIAEGLSQRIFADFAPKGTTYPFIIHQCQDPPRDVRGVGAARVFVDTLYVVKAVAQSDSYEDLAPVAHVIDEAMTAPEGGTVADGHVFTAIRAEQFALVEVEAGTQYRHLGGQYKMQAQG